MALITYPLGFFANRAPIYNSVFTFIFPIVFCSLGRPLFAFFGGVAYIFSRHKDRLV